MRLDVGCGPRKEPEWIGIDKVSTPAVDIVHDLTLFPWPIEDDSVDEIRMLDVIEHLPDTVATMNELYRIAQRGCKVTIQYPYCRSVGAYSDPTHIRFFNENMIEYFRRPGSSKARENRYAFYTDTYWILRDRQLITYPFLRHVPAKLLRFLSRNMLDVIHAVYLDIEPEK